MTLSRLYHRLLQHRFLRFCVVGGVGFAVDTGVWYALAILAQHDVFTARALSILAAMTTTWLLNRIYTFRSRHRPHLREWLIYAAWMAVGAGVNYAVYAIIMLLPAFAPLMLQALCAILCGTAAALLLNYNTMRLFVFRDAS